MIHRLSIKIVVWCVLSVVLVGMTGCGSKKAEENEKAQSVTPNDSMQKAYGGGGRPGASAQSPK